ncbi:MAG: sulfite exporter TauE/SafE family protein [Woeseiaceae bacterium]|nr:sulfite exporter TauE/SafE family protein [Woeseiaceae bacterium]
MDFTLYWFMFPVAICVATCAMLSGIGGAALFTPIFVLIFPLLGEEYVLSSTVAAIAAALITQTFGFLSGFIGYQRRRLIDYGLASRLLIIAVPVAIAGAMLANAMPDHLLLAGYALLVLLLAVGLFQQTRTRVPVRDDVPQELRLVIDSAGNRHEFLHDGLHIKDKLLTGVGAFMTGLVSVGIGEVTISQLTRRGVPIAVAAATSVLVVILTVATASSALAVELIRDGGWAAVPWHLLVWDIPGVLIGGQIGPRLQGRFNQRTLQKAIAVMFVVIGIAMATVAWQRGGLH